MLKRTPDGSATDTGTPPAVIGWPLPIASPTRSIRNSARPLSSTTDPTTPITASPAFTSAPAESGAVPTTGTTRLRAVERCCIRETTSWLAAPLSPEDQTVQSMPDVSPTKWHRAHVTWFFETFVLAENESGFAPFQDKYWFLFNSYYEAVGPRYNRAERGVVSRPGAHDVVLVEELRQLALDEVAGQDAAARESDRARFFRHHDGERVGRLRSRHRREVARAERARPPGRDVLRAHVADWHHHARRRNPTLANDHGTVVER